MRLVDTHTVRNSHEDGSALMQVLVALTIIAVMSLGLIEGTMTTNRLTTKATYHLQTSLLAQNQMNELASMNPELISSFDGTEETIEVDNVEYLRTISVTIESDRTRRVVVTVTALDTNQSAETTLENGFALWGSR